jgi:drug/metabolite transporter (DMT)-like permease
MKLSRRSVIDVGLLVLVNAMWAAQYPGYKVAGEVLRPVTLSGWTFLMAALVLLPFLVRERWVGRKQQERVTLPDGLILSGKTRLLEKRNLVGFLMIGILGLMPASVFLAWGIDRSSASNAALIYLTVPIITALLASVILNEKMTLVRWLSLIIALVGVLILSDFDWRHLDLTSNQYLIGNLLVLLACATSAFYNVYCKELLRRFTPLEVLIYGYLLAVALCLPLSVWLEGFSPASILNYHLATWVALLALSGLSWGMAMVLWLFLLKRLDVSQASVSVYLLPFMGVLVSAVTVHESITARMLVGGLVTLVGTLLVTTTEATAT